MNKNPSYNAFSKFYFIFKNALNHAKKYHKKDVCFILSLGHSAKILTLALYENDYKAFDMGNMSISYDAFSYGADLSYIDTLKLSKKYILDKYIK